MFSTKELGLPWPLRMMLVVLGTEHLPVCRRSSSMYFRKRVTIITTVDYVKRDTATVSFFFMAPSTTPQWQIIRPWAPSLCLAVKEITSVSATFILSSTLSHRESDPSLASRGLIAAAEESDLQDTEPVASSSAISPSLCSNNEESLKSKTRSFIADALANGLSVTVNGSPWPRAFIRIDEQSDEAVIIVYALMPGRQYDVELGLVPNDQQSSNNDNATIPHLNSQIITEGESFFLGVSI